MEVVEMFQEEVLTYEIQSEKEKDKWYQVRLEPRENECPKGRCTCAEYLWQGKHCSHIERAVSCYVHGF
jgi:hypothetical protein